VPAARALTPCPFLVGLACAANIGSAATLIGNPQNMLIGSVLQLPFGTYLRQALPPVALAWLALLWAWLAVGRSARLAPRRARRRVRPPRNGDRWARPRAPDFDAWQTAKGCWWLPR
jgi:Na+/H+ antiporter NhaD/arsenite permease-like protein